MDQYGKSLKSKNDDTLLLNSKLSLFAIGALFALMAMITPMDTAVAQDSEESPEGDGDYKDGEHEGKSCPFKERKQASIESGSSA